MSFFIFANITINWLLVLQLRASYVTLPIARSFAGPNFIFIPCLELDTYVQRANLCFSKTLKKIANFSFLKLELDQCIETYFV